MVIVRLAVRTFVKRIEIKELVVCLMLLNPIRWLIQLIIGINTFGTIFNVFSYDVVT